jgi:hypothetical protein
MMTSDDPLAAMRLIREHIKELQQRNDELQRRNVQLELAATLAQPLVDAALARMKELVETYEASPKPKNKGGRPRDTDDDVWLANKALDVVEGLNYHNKTKTAAASLLAENDLKIEHKENWVEVKKTENGKKALKSKTKTWQTRISNAIGGKKTPCE